MMTSVPLTRDLVLVGGGHTHALVLRAWGMRPLPGARLTLINPGPTAPYTGMLPGHVAGHYDRSTLDIDLVQLARFAGARLILDKAVDIDADAGQIALSDRAPVAYDVASIDIGITAEMPQMPGFVEHATGAKPLGHFADRWRDYLARVRKGSMPAQVAIIGGGVAGAELSLAVAHALSEIAHAPQVTLIEAADDLTGIGLRTRTHLLDAMQVLGVTLRTGATVTEVTADAVITAAGPVPSAFTIGAAGAFPWRWLQNTSLPLENGFIRTRPDLRVEGHDTLFASGDCAHLIASPRPKAGVFAVRAAPVLTHNLRAALAGGARRQFNPQKHYLKLVSLGGKDAIAEKWGYALRAPRLWQWKDRIDRKFMDRLSDLPTMPRPTPPKETARDVRALMRAKPLCGGCGAKIGAQVLGDVLAHLPVSTRNDIKYGPGDDAAVLTIGGQDQVITTDHLRAFTLDPGVMARIAAVHALGDIWSMGASPQAALVQIILPRMSEPLQARSLSEIMSAAQDIVGAAGAEIVGGHSTMGDELTIGFTMTGLLTGPAITQSGAQPGDALILTRPLGTGALLAAEMAGAARGDDIAALLARMQQPQGAAAKALQNAHAMTDVTGFGLAGHLHAICAASGVGAVIHGDALPIYPGAEEALARGHASTLAPANAASAPVAGAPDGILYDPQTAGGLLACVSAQTAKETLARLHETDPDAAIIGQITPEQGLFLR